MKFYLLLLYLGMASVLLAQGPPLDDPSDIAGIETTAELHQDVDQSFRIHEGEYFPNIRGRVDRSYHGVYNRERIATHDEIIKRILEEYKPQPQKKPRIILMSGPVGAGKTSVMKQMRDRGILDDSFVIVDADKLKTYIPEYPSPGNIGPNDPTKVQKESTYLMDLMREVYLDQNNNIIIQGTQRDRGFLQKMLERLRRQYPQYSIENVHVWASPDEIRKRTIKRDSLMGRRVPDEVLDLHLDNISHRHPDAYRFDRTITFNNDGEAPKLIEDFHLKHLDSGKKGPHLAVDVDWTIFYKVDEKYKDLPGVISYGNEHFKVADHAPKVLEKLSKQGLPISFYSGGQRDRVEFLLKQVPLPSRPEKSLFDMADKILSFENLKQRNPGKEPFTHSGSGTKFWRFFEKDLGMISEDVGNVVLADDLEFFARESQYRNVHWMQRTYQWYPNEAERALAHAADPTNVFIPPDGFHMQQERNKFPLMYDIYSQAIKDISNGSTSSFSELVHAQTHRDGEWAPQFTMENRKRSILSRMHLRSRVICILENRP